MSEIVYILSWETWDGSDLISVHRSLNGVVEAAREQGGVLDEEALMLLAARGFVAFDTKKNPELTLGVTRMEVRP